LFPLWIEAKRMLEDWPGVIEISHMADRISPSADNVYYRAQAFREIGVGLVRAGNLEGAAERFREGAREVSKAFSQGHTRGRVTELRDLGVALYVDYVGFLDQSVSGGNAIDVWSAACEAFRNHCRKSFLFKTGLRALKRWWDTVELVRETPHPRTADRLDEVLASILEYRRKLIDVDWRDSELLDQMQSLHAALAVRLREYRHAITRSPPSMQPDVR
jgi:hypothetical protein